MNETATRMEIYLRRHIFVVNRCFEEKMNLIPEIRVAQIVASTNAIRIIAVREIGIVTH